MTTSCPQESAKRYDQLVTYGFGSQARRRGLRREHAPTGQVDPRTAEGEGELRCEGEEHTGKGNVVMKQSSRGLRMKCSATRRRGIAVGFRWGPRPKKLSERRRSPELGKGEGRRESEDGEPA